jgi:hypothetical protein
VATSVRGAGLSGGWQPIQLLPPVLHSELRSPDKAVNWLVQCRISFRLPSRQITSLNSPQALLPELGLKREQHCGRQVRSGTATCLQQVAERYGGVLHEVDDHKQATLGAPESARKRTFVTFDGLVLTNES